MKPGAKCFEKGWMDGAASIQRKGYRQLEIRHPFRYHPAYGVVSCTKGVFAIETIYFSFELLHPVSQSLVFFAEPFYLIAEILPFLFTSHVILPPFLFRAGPF